MSEIVREIEKYHKEVPHLSPETIRLLTLLLGGTQDVLYGPGDTIFIFGTSVSENQIIASGKFCHIFHTLRGNVRKVYITGGETHPGCIESREILSLINPSLYPMIDFRLEEKSKDTTGNVTEAIALGLDQHRDVLAITKWAHCRRAHLVLQKHLPHARIRMQGYVPVLPGSRIPITRDTWFEHELARQWAWGEFCRIQRYGERGDIAYPPEVQDLVQNIRLAVSFTS